MKSSKSSSSFFDVLRPNLWMSEQRRRGLAWVSWLMRSRPLVVRLMGSPATVKTPSICLSSSSRSVTIAAFEGRFVEEREVFAGFVNAGGDEDGVASLFADAGLDAEVEDDIGDDAVHAGFGAEDALYGGQLLLAWDAPSTMAANARRVFGGLLSN